MFTQVSSLLVLVWTLVQGDELPFQTFGSTGGVITRTLLTSDDDFSDGVRTVSGGIPYLQGLVASDYYVCDNGLVSLNDEFVDPPDQPGTDFSPLADGYGAVIIAPFWSDNDIRMSGDIRYEEYTQGATLADERLATVSEFVSNKTMSAFSATWMLLVEWDCPPFPAGEPGAGPTPDPNYTTMTNTYQAIIITDQNSQSYALFIYQCDQIEWSGIDPVHARIGITDGDGSTYTHPLSGNSSVLDIDCINNPDSNVVNILLDLTTFNTVEAPSPSSTVVTTMPTSTAAGLSTQVLLMSTSNARQSTQALVLPTATSVSNGLQMTQTATLSLLPTPASMPNDKPTEPAVPTITLVSIIVPTLVVVLIVIGTMVTTFICVLCVLKKKKLQKVHLEEKIELVY